MFANLVSYVQNSGSRFAFFFIVLALYGAVKTAMSLPDVLLARASPRPLLSTLGSILFVFSVAFLFFFVVDRALERINIAGIDALVARNNDALLRLDRLLFRVYVPFWFENENNPLNQVFRSLAGILVTTYASLPFVLAVSLVAALMKDGEIFSRAVAMYFGIIIVSMLGWYFLPATSPFDAYLDGVPPPVPREEVTRYLASYRASEAVVTFTNRLRQIRSQLGPRLWVTTIPSMHIAWAVVVTYTAMTLSRWLLLVALPYFLLNLISTMSGLQHYAVDVVAGLAVGFAAILVINRLPPFRITLVNRLGESMRRDTLDFLRLMKPPIPKRS